jgi:hypothetical protein
MHEVSEPKIIILFFLQILNANPLKKLVGESTPHATYFWTEEVDILTQALALGSYQLLQGQRC